MAYSYTDAQGNQWYINNYGNLQDAKKYYSSGGYTYQQDALDSTNAYLYINGATSYTSPTWGAATVSGNTQTVTGTLSSAGINWTRSTYVGDGFVRVTEIVQNAGASATNVRISLNDNIYYDSNTQAVATSSGDTARTTADDWAAYGSSSNTAYPKLVHVVSGGMGSPNSVTQPNPDTPETSFNLSLAAGQTQVIVHFYALAADTASATTIGNSISNLSSSAYLAGMSATELNALVNFTQDISSSNTATLTYNYQLNLTLTGSTAINGTGNAQNNLITGNTANNKLTGLGGNDTLNGGVGNDTMVGGTGNDTYVVDASLDVITENANEGNDSVRSYITYDISAQPYLENITLLGSTAIAAKGNTANNILDGSQNSAANTLTGSIGNDTYIVGAGDIIVEAAGEGTDTVQSAVAWTLGANLENLELTGSANINGTGNTLANTITGNAGRNYLSGGEGNDTLDGGTGVDTLDGGNGNDTYKVDNSSDVVTEAASAGTDTVIATVNYALGNNIENLTLSGAAFRGTGNGLNNKLTGNASDNLLDGGVGTDTMVGGNGSDTYVVDNAGDIVTEALNGGIDTVRTALNSYTLGANIENGMMLGTVATMNGNELNNRITGNRVANTIDGGQGNDSLLGGGGNDSLIGGDGNDLLVGDQGGPESQIASAETIVNGKVVALNLAAPENATGSVTVTGTISAVSLGQTGVNLVYIIDHSGSMSGSFSGSVNVPDMNGDGASNTTMDAAIASLSKLNQSIIDSGMDSQVRVSLIQFDDTAETIYSGTPGFDSDGDGTPDLAEQLFTLRPDGGTAYNMALTEAQNQLSSFGSGKNIVFFISDGDPTDGTTYQATAAAIRSMGQGGTTIRAIGTGSGAYENPLDLLDDGIDNGSAIIVMNPEELDATLLNTSVFELAESAWIEIYRDGVMVDLIGSDRFKIGPLGVGFESTAITLDTSGSSQISAKLMTLDANGAMIETSLPVQISQFVSNDTLMGGAGNDTLDGGVGTDSMVGGLGDDRYFVDNIGDIVVEASGEGTDIVVSRASSYTLGAGVENLELIGSAVTGNGNDFNNIITGNDSNNMLRGYSGNDSLTGGAGNDTLDGGAGNDTMEGGAGNDTYYVDSSYDYVQETSSGAGNDTVISSFDSTLGSYVSGVSTSRTFSYIENLTLLEGSSAVVAIGYTDDNVLTGNSNANKLYGLEGNDTLNGGAGTDTMDGSVGNDTYYVDNAGDVIIDSSGTDTVIASLNNYVLGAGIENLTLANNSTVLKGTGNALNNLLVGNSYANTLIGGAGADTMKGGAGNDIYYVDNAYDLVVEASGAGTDTVSSSISYKLTNNLENLTLTGTNGIGGAGNTLANNIVGNTGANRLLGYEGNDTINGGLGNDNLTGGNGADKFVFSTTLGSTNIDTITDFTSGTDKIVLDDDIFTALGVTGTSSGAALIGTTFQLGTAANDAGDRIIYDQTSGKLYYDADGTGPGGQVQIALIGATTHASLAASDFLVVA